MLELPCLKKKPTRLEQHGDIRVDNYFWLRERENPDVIAYLNAENAYTEKMMAPMKGLQGILFEEIKGRIKEDDQSAPVKRGDYYYYQRYVKGMEYPIYVRKKGSLDADEEILLDVNQLAGDADYFSVTGFEVSPDHRMAAYGVDTRGRRFYDLYFLDLDTSETLPETIQDTTGDFEWANDSQTILYTRQHPETLRSYRIFRHTIGEAEDALVYEEEDETNYLDIGKSLSGRFFILGSTQTLSTEMRFVSADYPGDEPTVFLQREDDHEYYLTDGGDRFYLMSNEGAKNFRILEAPLNNRDKSAWQEVMAHRDDVLIKDFQVFKDFLAVTVVENGLTQIEIIVRASGEKYRIAFDEEVYTADADDNVEFDTPWFRYSYESLTTPESTYDFNMVSKEQKLIKEEAVLGGFDQTNYQTERRFATARDGTQVPVSLVYRKGMEKNGQNPLLQYGYGSYGFSMEPWFDADVLSLLDRGFIYAIAHIRGGSEMGRDWYYNGRQLKKKNTFTDFIDVSKFLIEEGYTSAEHLYAQGGSAGGLLIGAVANMAPELYHGMVTRVPFVDVVTTMLDESIPLTAGEWDEWGDPRKKEFYDYMLSYSPYDQVKRQDYPNILVTTSLHDSQVQYWEPAKWVAKLRANKTDTNRLLLKTNMDAGHGGASGRYEQYRETALNYAFMLDLAGIEK